MGECQFKGLFYNCDDKYFPRHKCKEHNLFLAIFEDVLDEYVEVPNVEESPQEEDHTLPSNPP